MAPTLSGVWWGPEAGLAQAGPAARLPGVPLPVPVPVPAAALSALLLLSVFLLLCASCRGRKKAAGGQPAADRVDLMDGASDKETVSQSADSPATDACVGASRDGPFTSAAILADPRAGGPQPSEESPSGRSERRSSKCPRGRQLPSIPPAGPVLGGEAPPASGDGTYEVVKEMSAASRDVSVEDSLYETVKELKEPPKQPGLRNGTAGPSPPPPLLNGRAGGPEYASVDRNKKSRHSADLEAERRPRGGAARLSSPDLKEEAEDLPPPLPEKVLDENDNRPALMNGHGGPSRHYANVEPTPKEDAGATHEDKELDYSSIAELKGLIPAGSSGDLYASVKDVCAQPAGDGADPGYESIRLPKTGGGPDQERRRGPATDGSEPDYESVGELGLSRETSRL